MQYIFDSYREFEYYITLITYWSIMLKIPFLNEIRKIIFFKKFDHAIRTKCQGKVLSLLTALSW